LEAGLTVKGLITQQLIANSLKLVINENGSQLHATVKEANEAGITAEHLIAIGGKRA
jgi:hypothetical protein